MLDGGADLDVWEREDPKLLPKRRAVIEKARAQLNGPQCAPIGLANRRFSKNWTSLAPKCRHAFVMQRIDWQRAGFRKVQAIGTRDGHEQAPLPSSGLGFP